jgi:pimeloyl-ACP methyl ester carboxylesterase
MPFGLLVAAILLDLRPTARNNERFEHWVFRDLEQTRQRDPEWFDAFNAYSLSCGAVPHVKRAMRQVIDTGTKEIPAVELRHIRVPTGLLWGRYDRIAPLRLAEGASAQYGWPLQIVEDASHAPHIEQPGAFVQALHAALSTA